MPPSKSPPDTVAVATDTADQTVVLAQRAKDAGLDTLAYLLDTVRLEAESLLKIYQTK
jgi:hypothetical protein